MAMTEHLYIADRRALEDAAALLAEHGHDAVVEAAARASRSRDLGNILHFCHWKQTGRLVALLGSDEVPGTIH